MSAPRTLDEIVAQALARILDPNREVTVTDDVRAACVEHAAAETARLRAAGEALAKANRECLDEINRLVAGYNSEVYPSVESSHAALAAWQEALGVEVAR